MKGVSRQRAVTTHLEDTCLPPSRRGCAFVEQVYAAPPRLLASPCEFALIRVMHAPPERALWAASSAAFVRAAAGVYRLLCAARKSPRRGNFGSIARALAKF